CPERPRSACSDRPRALDLGPTLLERVQLEGRAAVFDRTNRGWLPLDRLIKSYRHDSRVRQLQVSPLQDRVIAHAETTRATFGLANRAASATVDELFPR